MRRCEHCDTRISDEEVFTYRGFGFCINCMESFISWLLDDGQVQAPEMYAYVFEPEPEPEKVGQ